MIKVGYSYKQKYRPVEGRIHIFYREPGGDDGRPFHGLTGEGIVYRFDSRGRDREEHRYGNYGHSLDRTTEEPSTVKLTIPAQV